MPCRSGLFITTTGRLADQFAEKQRFILTLEPSPRVLHLPTVSNTLFASDRLADSVATGYHTTYPIPRTAVNDLPIGSQSLCSALSSGTPIRVSRVTSSGITPSYP